VGEVPINVSAEGLVAPFCRPRRHLPPVDSLSFPPTPHALGLGVASPCPLVILVLVLSARPALVLEVVAVLRGVAVMQWTMWLRNWRDYLNASR